MTLILRGLKQRVHKGAKACIYALMKCMPECINANRKRELQTSAGSIQIEVGSGFRNSVKIQNMDWFHKLPGFARGAPGLEWKLWKKLPYIAVTGIVVPLLWWAAIAYSLPDQPTAAELRSYEIQTYLVIGAVTLHISLTLTVFFGAIIVMVMKGPAYVADGYDMKTGEIKSYPKVHEVSQEHVQPEQHEVAQQTSHPNSTPEQERRVDS